MIKTLFLFLLLFLIISTVNAQPKYEFRGVWIATVDNIDWPLRGQFNAESQKQEFIRQIEMHKRNGMNAMIVQVRPAADAFYPSPFEPWSQWLTGKQGKAPYPYYDPLQFMIEETHKRGMEFHAWLNPYRANFNTRSASIAATHLTRKRPDLFLTYGGKKYFDPGNKEGQAFVVKVVRDIVKRYDIDAIHMDDYFYPYRVPGKEFPDQRSYIRANTNLTKAAWRRSNVDSIIVKIAKAIKEEKPFVRFGISPFGVWRNQSQDSRGSATQAGVTNYDDLYADILLWLENGWIDYVTPQIYWEFEHKAAPFEVLVDWWSRNTYGRHCYIGLAPYRANSNAAWRDKSQLPDQIALLREYPELQGAIFYSSKSFYGNPNGWNDSLQNNYYRKPALVPSMPYLQSPAPAQPIIAGAESVTTGYIGFTVKTSSSLPKPKWIAVHATVGGESDFNKSQLELVIPFKDSINIRVSPPAGTEQIQYFVTYVSPTNQESIPNNPALISLRYKNVNGIWLLD